MALNDNDLEKIGQIVNKEIGSLRLEMNQRFDKTDQKIESVRVELKEEIRQVKQMETEDIAVLYKDVAHLKKKMAA